MESGRKDRDGIKKIAKQGEGEAEIREGNERK